MAEISPADQTGAGLRWGIMGCGLIADLFVTDLLATGHQVAAVGSRSEAKAREFAANFGIQKAWGSYLQLVMDPTVDIIYVATPHSRHHADAALAIKAGKHVLVEKAFTQNAAQAEALVALARDNRVFAMEAMWSRFLPHMVELREFIDSGAIGPVRYVTAIHDQMLNPDPQARLRNPELAGGALLDLGVYPLSFAVDLLGLPESVNAIGTLTPEGVDREESVTMLHPGGTQSISHAALDLVSPNIARIVCEDGWLYINPTWYTATGWQAYSADGKLITESRPEVASRGMQYEADEVERCVAAGLFESSIMPLDESVGIMRVLDEVRAKLGVVYPNE